jgi:hypothetical protein
MAQYTYKLSKKALEKKNVSSFNHGGKVFTVDQSKPEAFEMVTSVEHPAPDFMGLRLVDKRD